VTLGPVSYVVLGLLDRDGPSTPYELKAAVGRGVAAFWPFPHSQIYAETQRLTGFGLLAEEREDVGRRRRTYRVTAAGRGALRAWLAEPTTEEPQLRSLALLQLYFGQLAEPSDIAALAGAQLRMHAGRLDGLDRVIGRLTERGDPPWQLTVAHLLRDADTAMVAHWQRIRDTLSAPPPP